MKKYEKRKLEKLGEEHKLVTCGPSTTKKRRMAPLFLFNNTLSINYNLLYFKF